MAGAREARASPLFWVKKEEMTEGRKAGWASKIKPGPLSSKCVSATESNEIQVPYSATQNTKVFMKDTNVT